MANSSSLSNVVSSLVRAQMGSSISTNTLDEELDRRVAELILKEAKKSETRYGNTGSYSPQPATNAVRTNKRFLTSIIKSTDEHNKAILKAQAETANEVKQQREREEREERMRRAQEAVAARHGSSPISRNLRGYEDSDKYDDSREGSERHQSSRHSRKRRRDCHSDSESGDDHRKKRTRQEEVKERKRSATPERRKDRDRRKERKPEDDKRSSHRSSHKDRDRDERRSHHRSHHRSRSRSPTRERKREEGSSKASSSTRHRSSRDNKHPSRSESLEKSRSKRPTESEPLRRTAEEDHTPASSAIKRGAAEAADFDGEVGPQPAVSEGSPKQFSSKMDKYFAEDYDPRLDVTTSLTNMDGFLPPGAFDNWDMMLQVVRQRREEKEERKRLEKLHRGSSSSKTKKEPVPVSQPVTEVVDLLSIQYTKRGGVRQWDEGKKVT